MKNRLPLLILLGAVALTAWSALSSVAPAPPAPTPAPRIEPTPQPQPEPGPCPGPGPCPRPKPWGLRFGPPVGGQASANLGGEVGPDGTELQCPLPGEFHTKNVGGSD